MLALSSDLVVTPEDCGPATVIVESGRIVEVRPRRLQSRRSQSGRSQSDRSLPSGCEHVELGGLALLPGLVDLHVHINEPGRTEWEGFSTATRAAAAGGVTTVIDMPLNSSPATTTTTALALKHRAAAGQLHVDVGFWGGVVPNNVGQLPGLAEAGVFGFKAFLAPSGIDDFGHVGRDEVRAALVCLRELGLPLLVHAEIVGPAPALLDRRCYREWLGSRPQSFEVEAVELLVELLREVGGRVHVVHVSSTRALEVIRRAREEGAAISAETCPHYLHFAAEEIGDGDPRFKCAPPIREARHREALWEGLCGGVLETVGSDHSPAPADLKQLETGDLQAAWGGIASLELGFSAVWHGARRRGVGIGEVVEWLATNPARIAGLAGRKGAIVAGADADLVAVDLAAEWLVDQNRLHQRHPITPYHGQLVTGRVERTWLRGRVAYGRDLPWPVPGGCALRR